MNEHLSQLTDRDLGTIAAVLGADPEELVAELEARPWRIHDILSDPDLFDVVMDRKDHPAAVISPRLLFSVLMHRAAAELREAAFVHDWLGPRSRLPVFDVDPLREFVGDPGRLFFLAGLLARFAVPAPPPVPADPLDLDDMARWVGAVLPHQRAALMMRLGDLSLFLSGVYPDRTGAAPLGARQASRLGETVGMSSDEILELLDASAGLTAIESLGSRWYEAALESGGVPPVVGDVAARFRSARRVLNHLTDGYLYRLDLRPNAA